MKYLYIILLLSFTSSASAQHDWTRTNPGGGGALDVSGATVSGTILVASDLSGVYRSTDDGQSFDVVGANQGMEETHTNAFGFDPNDGDTYYVGSYSYLYKTTDGGNNFSIVFPTATNTFEYSYIEDVVVAATNSNIAYVTHNPGPETDTEIYKTTDGGVVWNNVSVDFPDDVHIVKLMVHPMDENVVYALSGKTRWGCGEAHLLRSINGGINWTVIGVDAGDILDMDLHPTNPEIVFISTFETNYINNTQCQSLEFGEYVSDDEDAGALFKSSDGGQSFTQIGDYTGIISVGIENPDIIRVLDILLPFDWNDNAGTWESTDGGESWTHTGFVENWNRGYAENQYFAFAGSFAGLNKTVRKDLFNSDRYFGTFGQWAWASFDGGVTLHNINSIEVSENHWLSSGVENIVGHALDVNDADPNVIYMGAWDIGFWYSIDHGASWARSVPDYNVYPEYSWNLGEPGTVDEGEAKRGSGSNVLTIISDPTQSNIVWASFSAEQLTDPIENSYASTGLFKSTNYGEDWTLISEGLPSYEESIRMYGLSIDINSPIGNRILYITIDGSVYKSSDDGVTWNMILGDQDLTFTEVDRFDGNIVYAGGKQGVWRSMDAGNTWVEVGTNNMHNLNSNIRPDIVPTWISYSGVENLYPWEGVFDILSDPNVEGRLYVTVLSPIGGLYRSEDHGDTWSENLLPDTHLRGIAVSPANSNVIYATSSKSYHSGGFGNSLGVQYSIDAGATWQDANDGMAFSYAGMIEVETGSTPRVWTWGLGTGMQYAQVPFFTGIEVFQESNGFSIFPNPAKDNLTIRFNADNSTDRPSTIGVYSPNGQLIISQPVNNISEQKLDIHFLPKGVYLLKVKFESGSESVLFTKN